MKSREKFRVITCLTYNLLLLKPVYSTCGLENGMVLLYGEKVSWFRVFWPFHEIKSPRNVLIYFKVNSCESFFHENTTLS